MPGQRRDFTDMHKAACVRARAELGMSHREIADAAESEGLYGVKFPRRPSVSTVQEWCEQEVSPEQIQRRLYRALDATITLELPKREGEKAVSFISQCLGAIEKRPKLNRDSRPQKPEKTSTEDHLRSESLERLAAASKEKGAEGGAIVDADARSAARAPAPELAPTT